MKITKAIRKSHRYNEDKIIIGNNYFIVCDGATPLYKSNIKPSAAAWFVTFIKKNMPNKTVNVIDELKKISKLAYDEFRKLSENNVDDVLFFPSCGLSILQIKDKKAFVYTIGDCEAIIRKKDDRLDRSYQTNLSKLDEASLNCMITYSKEKNVSLLVAKENCKEILIKHRKMMNKHNGYPIYTISRNPNFEYNELIYDLDELKEIYLYTDGIAQAYDELKIYDSWKEMFQESIDPQIEINKIVNCAFDDRKCEKYPRFKVIDDIAIVKIEF